MKSNKSVSAYLFDSFNRLFMVVMILITLYPLYYVLAASFSNSTFLLSHTGLLLWPEGITASAYRLVFQNPNIMNGYLNTILIVAGGTMLNLILTCMGAYVLSRKRIAWTKPVMLYIVFTMFFSGGLIPTYLLVNNWLHLGNSLLALIIPGAVSTMNLIIMRTSFASIPESLVESAKIDGANDFYILAKIIVPLSMPVIAVMVLFYGVQHWNSWFSAMIYLQDRSLFPLQLVLREILIQNSTEYLMSDASSGDIESVSESIKYATIIVATLPIVVVYPFLQKYFVKGVMIGSIKE
ncbi:carbohydrate ABC transporter permease [Paenibacillaceae bacterium]|nr:carbohydrate ABC transporter permease [Paenibacillaceae bacterium]